MRWLAGLLIVAALVGGGASAQEPAAGATSRFDAGAAAALDAMVAEAGARGMKGVAVVAFVPGEKTQDWASRMRVVDALVQGQANVLAIAYCKLSEMADTLRDSGSKIRPPLHGELGYRGGAIRKTPQGWILAAFSGGKDTDDLDVANKGLDSLERSLKAEPAAK